MALKYLGPGYIVGVPARDLTDEDLSELDGLTPDELVAGGLYAAVGAKPVASQPSTAPAADTNEKGDEGVSANGG